MVYLRALSEGRFRGLISYSVSSVPAWLHHNIAISAGTGGIITATAKQVVLEVLASNQLSSLLANA